MGLTNPVVLTAPQAVNLPFTAKGIIISNPTGKWVFVSVGGNIVPGPNASDIYAPPYTYVSQPIPPTSRFGLGLSTPQGPASTQASNPIVTFSEDVVPVQFSAINLPNVTFQGVSANQFVTNLAPGATFQLVAPVAGQTLQLFKIQGEFNVIGGVASTNYLFTFLWWDGAGPQTRIIAHSYNASVTDLPLPLDPPLDWIPFGLRAPAPGLGLYVGLTGGAGYQGYFDLSVLYAFGL